MSFGFMPGMLTKARMAEARLNCCIIGDTVVRLLFVAGDEIDWEHPRTRAALANNLSITLRQTGYHDHCGEIWTR